MIKTIIFDLGGVVVTIDHEEALRRFSALGLRDAGEWLDPYTQKGIFGQLESGDITAEDFRRELCALVGHEVTMAECEYAWQGYAKEVPRRNLDALVKLRGEGYRLLLLSNTNPCMMAWAMSPDFDGRGHAVSHYFDACYLSYKMKVMKPDGMFFRRVLMAEQTPPGECIFVDDGPRNVAAASQIGINTLCPANGEDWTQQLDDMILSINT